LHLALAGATGSTRSYVECTLPDALLKLQKTRDLLEEKAGLICEKYSQDGITADPILGQMDEILGYHRNFIPRDFLPPSLVQREELLPALPVSESG
jgi:hypothetical protein